MKVGGRDSNSRIGRPAFHYLSEKLCVSKDRSVTVREAAGAYSPLEYSPKRTARQVDNKREIPTFKDQQATAAGLVNQENEGQGQRTGLVAGLSTAEAEMRSNRQEPSPVTRRMPRGGECWVGE
jgi:hypothetical protein